MSTVYNPNSTFAQLIHRVVSFRPRNIREPVEAPRPKPAPPRKLSFNEKRELQELPARIEALEAEQHALHARVQGPEFYKEGASAIAQALGRLEQIKTELDRAYARWGELESRGA